MSRPSEPVIVFADVDAAPACPLDRVDRLAGLLQALADRRIMPVFLSRRTRAEVEGIRQSLGVFHPFVCESGGAAFVPRGYFGAGLEQARSVDGYQAIEFGSPYEHVVDRLRSVVSRLALNVAGFSDMSVETVARECGCTCLDARLAKRREYNEAFRLLEPDALAERRLLRALNAAGLTSVRRDGFHYAGTVRGPAAAVATLTALYRAVLGSVVTIGVVPFAPSPDHVGRVDVRLESRRAGGRPPRTQVDWLERIVQDIEKLRDPEPGPAAGAARQVTLQG